MEKINREVAEKDFFRWVENFGYKPADFEEEGLFEKYKDQKNRIVKSIMDGFVIIENDGKLTQIFKDAISDDKGEVVLKQITYKSDYQAWEQNNAMKGIDIEKESAKITLAIASMLSGHGRAILGKLRSFDYKILQAVTVFFMV